MEEPEFKVKIFDTSHFNVIGLISDVWKVVLRFLRGFIDSCRFDHMYILARDEPRIWSIVTSCFLLNIVYMGVMVLVETLWNPLFDSLIAGAVGDSVALGVIGGFLSWLIWLLYQVLWAATMFVVSFVRSMKYGDELVRLVPAPMLPRVADKSAQKRDQSNWVTNISDTASFVLQLCLLKVANSALSFIPYTGWWMSAVLQCLLASFYAFESHYHRIHPAQQSGGFISWMERDWSYFLGFGVILTAVTIQLPVFMSLALYDAILPIFIVVASRPQAAAWQHSSQKQKPQVLPQSIRYFDIGHKAADLLTIWCIYFYFSFLQSSTQQPPSHQEIER